MSGSWVRRAVRVRGWVLFLVLFLPGRICFGCPRDGETRLAPDVWQGDRTPVWLEGSGAPPVLVYPPSVATQTAAPLLVLLHGMCGHPENECPWFAGSATRDHFVVCPRADLACAGGGHIWSGSSRTRSELVERAREDVECAFPGRVDAEKVVLAGFSLGGFVALDVAEHAAEGRWPSVLVIGARVAPSPARLRRAGVDSLLFASGDWDLARSSMQDSARLLAGRGIHARYVGLGPVGHWFARDLAEMDGWLTNALEWLDVDRIARQ